MKRLCLDVHAVHLRSPSQIYCDDESCGGEERKGLCRSDPLKDCVSIDSMATPVEVDGVDVCVDPDDPATYFGQNRSTTAMDPPPAGTIRNTSTGRVGYVQDVEGRNGSLQSVASKACLDSHIPDFGVLGAGLCVVATLEYPVPVTTS